LQRKADLGRIRKQIDALSAQVDGFHNGSHERQREVSRLQTELGKTREKIGEQEEALAEAKSFLRTVEEEFRSAQRDLERLEREVAKEIPAAEGPPLPVHEFEQARDLALKALAAQSADADSSEARLREAERLLERSRQRVEAAIRRREQELQAERSREKRQESLVPDRERYLQLIETEAKRVGDHGLKAEAARQSMSFLKALSQQKAAEREAELAGANVSRQSAQVAREMLHQAELNRTRAEAKRFGALSKLAEEYSISESDLAGLSCAVPPPDAATLVARLRRELRAMGDVNMGAIEAYERLSTRLDELHGQKEDILGAIQEVENSVQELDRLTRDRFTTTFTAVQERFAQTFGRLFEGGVGTVELTHPDDILNSGIEIRVVLPGKKRQPLSLLSGGEQSLCTTAFLFSLLKVKPSPLVVLDEVDAPLDGRNVERYAELLKELSEEMQFIVITHNPVTIEMADTWLGVTMQEPGVSNLVPASAPRGS
jgi:chromosome segregation protein